MALSKEVLENQINGVIDAVKSLPPQQAQAQFVSLLAETIINTLKSADVIVNAGIAVNTDPNTGIGSTTSIGSGNLT